MENEWIESILKKFESDKSIARVISVERNLAASPGDSFTSALERLKVKVVLGSGMKAEKNLVVKVLPKSEVARDYISTYFVVQKEIRVYEYLFRNMEALMEAHGDKRETLWCDLIGYHPYNTIVLQDLTELNYVVPHRKAFLNLEYCLLAVRGLARFHAMSSVLVSRRIIDKQVIGSYQLVYDPKTVEVFVEGAVLSLYKGILASWGTEWAPVAERVKRAACNTEAILRSLANVNNEKYNTVNHGDFWLCNLLFKTDDYLNKPISVKFIDFQLVHYNSFAWDLISLLYSCVTPEFRRRHICAIYDAYYDTLIKTLKFYNYIGPIANREEIDEEMERLEFFGFIMLCTMFALSISDVETPFDIEMFGKRGQEKNGFNPLIYQSAMFKDLVQEDLAEFVKRKII